MGKVPKKKRLGFVLDMTPLVDITFLLLTFFMFTAKFKSDAESEQKFIIKRPEVSPDTSKLPDKDLATLKIAIDSVSNDTSYYYEVSNPNDRQRIWAASNVPEDQLKKGLLQIGGDVKVLDDLIRNTRLTSPKTVFAVDADVRIRYKWVSDAMDVLRKNRATIFNFITEKKK
ncbi:MAG: biopolymer transporter ExbD [Candidatus Kapabacteria bacterium]|jgi:biopolymer transport protein ExbD|nr:biopolymer transporter ExbD [Candidatus Kapabacteria bacterium]